MKIRIRKHWEEHALVEKKRLLFNRYIPNRWRYPKGTIYRFACNGPTMPMDEISREVMGDTVFIFLELHGQDEYSIGDRHGIIDLWKMNHRNKGKRHSRY